MALLIRYFLLRQSFQSLEIRGMARDLQTPMQYITRAHPVQPVNREGLNPSISAQPSPSSVKAKEIFSFQPFLDLLRCSGTCIDVR